MGQLADMEHDFYIGLSYGVTVTILGLLTARTLRAYLNFRKQIDDAFKSDDAPKSV
ncbi:hypothetical protein IMCC14465_10350 [alpha proteobacterium IMCC14465]|uniref:Heme exporter protein D n=1 Tax=alpha proteobacterium IMCC14465 TaxID=1220535 RepID=J9DZV6_9PROT|nr:hypothetical protein IMCC14465_10350 [alpha proteobacterium IMCC14465]